MVFQEKSKAAECYYPHFKVSGKVMNRALPDKEWWAKHKAQTFLLIR